MTARADTRVRPVQGQHRYGMVFGLVLLLVLFEITSPAAAWARAVDVALAAAALIVAIATSRAARRVRQAWANLVIGVAVVIVIGVATEVFGVAVAFLVITLLIACIPVALIGGVLRLMRQDGVTVEAVAGALAIYLLVGLLFASIIAFVARVQSGDYFHQGSTTAGDDVYFSFTVLTTTGFGDYTPAAPFGHALAVLEMLTGQLYLVTVIGIIVGNFAGRQAARRPQTTRDTTGRGSDDSATAQSSPRATATAPQPPEPGSE